MENSSPVMGVRAIELRVPRREGPKTGSIYLRSRFIGICKLCPRPRTIGKIFLLL
jgi:hypothetical protein